jgi:UDP-N-acetylglucosamine 2-epimerase (non-hydrolysing)
MPRKTIDLIVGARPNFVKVAPVHRALRAYEMFDLRLIHTGQHYDVNMSDVFFTDLEIPKPDVFLGVGSGPHGAQTGAIMEQYERVLIDSPPDLVLVFGDVNSTMACSLAAVKLHIPVGHVEAGLRSFDRTMPEEINRVVTDHVADLLFTPSPDADTNLEREGIPAERVHRVGNVMIDSLIACHPKVDASGILQELGVEPRGYALLTMHRPSNVDDDDSLARILVALAAIQDSVPILFPIHPRTRPRLASARLKPLTDRLHNVRFLEPHAYCDFMRLMRDAALVVTDSGGVQEETTYLGVPCLTMRPNTERPITIEQGTSVLVGNDTDAIVREARRALQRSSNGHRPPDLWDGKTAPRIAVIVQQHLRCA